MKILVIIRTKISAVLIQQNLLKIIKALKEQIENPTINIFLMEEGVSIASKDHEIEALKQLQEQYLKLVDENFKIYVCGRALKDLGFNSRNLKTGFILSGNMELSGFIKDADRILEL